MCDPKKVPATKSGQNRERAGNLPASESTLNQSRALAAGSFSGCFSPRFGEANGVYHVKVTGIVADLGILGGKIHVE